MGIAKAFFADISLLVSLTLLLNLSYKTLFSRLSARVKYLFSLLWFTLAGWLTMIFAFEIDEARFDLRYVPLIFGILVFPSPVGLFIIGCSIGLLRLTLGADAAGYAGFLNMVILGVFSAWLAQLFGRRPHWPPTRKAVAAILSVNALNIVNISIFGIIPPAKYLVSIAPVSFTVSVALSFFFYLIIRDLEKESNSLKDLSRTNRQLRIRTDDLHRAKRELERKNGLLEETSRYKSEFLSYMSGELKTPVHLILELSQKQALPETDDKDRRLYGELIYQSCQDLTALVNDILDLSKVEAGRLELTVEQVLLEDTLQSMGESLGPLAARKGLDFRIRRSADAPVWLRTDPFRLNQILRNLLTNAIKFTDDGKVELILSRGTGGTGEDDAVFRIRDTGVGSERGKREALLEAFRQEGALNLPHSGSGLGLLISRQMAGLLGGRLENESGPVGESCFILTLPNRDLEPDRRGSEANWRPPEEYAWK